MTKGFLGGCRGHFITVSARNEGEKKVYYRENQHKGLGREDLYTYIKRDGRYPARVS